MEFSCSLEDGPPRLLRTSGPLDITTASRFADLIDTASRGGVHPLVIDLTGVEVLASAAVRVLFTARDAHATHAHSLTQPGSLAEQVLDLVGLAEHSPPDAPPGGAHAGR